MSGEIVVASESVRTQRDMTVEQAVRDHRDPDGVAEVLASPHESVATGESATTLDEFASE